MKKNTRKHILGIMSFITITLGSVRPTQAIGIKDLVTTENIKKAASLATGIAGCILVPWLSKKITDSQEVAMNSLKNGAMNTLFVGSSSLLPYIIHQGAWGKAIGIGSGLLSLYQILFQKNEPLEDLTNTKITRELFGDFLNKYRKELPRLPQTSLDKMTCQIKNLISKIDTKQTKKIIEFLDDFSREGTTDQKIIAQIMYPEMLALGPTNVLLKEGLTLTSGNSEENERICEVACLQEMNAGGNANNILTLPTLFDCTNYIDEAKKKLKTLLLIKNKKNGNPFSNRYFTKDLTKKIIVDELARYHCNRLQYICNELNEILHKEGKDKVIFDEEKAKENFIRYMNTQLKSPINPNN